MKWELVLIGFLLVSSSGLCLTPFVEAQSDPVLQIAASLAPLGGIVNEIGQGYVSVEVLLPEGVEPHSTQLPESAIETADNADLLVLTGHFPWEETLANQTSTPYITLEDYKEFGAALSPLPGEHEEEDGEHDHGNVNPHSYWLLPKNAVAIANATRNTFTSMHPELTDYWSSMFNAFVEDIGAFQDLVDELDDEYHFSDLKTVVIFPAEAYVAEAFGIEIEAVLQEGDNIFISGAKLLEVQTALANGSLDLIIGSDVARLQAGGEFAQQLAQDTNSKIIWVRAIFFSGLADYVSIMTYNLGSLVTGLENEVSNTTDTTINQVLIGISGFLLVVVIVETGLLVIRIRKEE
ncbi:MAG: metal ABC transporter substrate-binding protein [Candidatus Thorarchaeota archaeon]